MAFEYRSWLTLKPRAKWIEIHLRVYWGLFLEMREKQQNTLSVISDRRGKLDVWENISLDLTNWVQNNWRDLFDRMLTQC